MALLMLVVVGCGAPAPQAGNPSAAVQLHIHLPSSLSRSERRWEAFRARVIRLELEALTRSGARKTVAFPPGDWDRIALPPLAFPASPQDVLQVRVKVWDGDASAGARPVPALSGKAVLKAGEVATDGPTHLHLKLSLHVSVLEYGK